ILSEWVGTDLRPTSIIGDRGFAKAIRFASSATTVLEIPSRQTVALRVHENASERRLSLRVMLVSDNECDFYSASSDIWTSIKCESFISLTVHYLDSLFNMKSWTLE
ncbi:hypothetical protein PHYSODRAFT_406446, partial [Phytophthora sojae]